MYCFICFIVVLITVANNCIFGVHHPPHPPKFSDILMRFTATCARINLHYSSVPYKELHCPRLGTHISLQRNKAVCMVLVVKHTCYSRNCHHGSYHYYHHRNYHHGDYLHRNYNYQ